MKTPQKVKKKLKKWVLYLFRENGALHGVTNGPKWNNAQKCRLFKNEPVISEVFILVLIDRGPLNKKQKDDQPAFLAFFHLRPFATPCNAPFSRKKVYSINFHGFWFFKGQGWGQVNTKSDRSTTCILWRSFIWDHFQLRAMHRFPRKNVHCYFLGVLIFLWGTKVP